MKPVHIVGGGLVGSLTALMFARRKIPSVLYERRPDLRKHKISAGRSVNLALSVRGIEALSRVGLSEKLLDLAIPMKGRFLHPLKGEQTLLPYGKTDHLTIHSVSRGGLNQALLDACEESKLVEMHFDRRIQSMSELPRDAVIFGTDGSASAIREEICMGGVEKEGLSISQDTLAHSYKELTIEGDSKGGFKLEKNALHIWPRNSYMLIALPNLDGSFTCTLFLATHGPHPSFDTVTTPETLTAFFEEQFPDALKLMTPEGLSKMFFENPTGHMVTVKSSAWHSFKQNQTLLLGDAAHAIVPFFGQGMNCGFEDVSTLDDLIQVHGTDWSKIFPEMTRLRKPNSDAIADLAIENFYEMRDRVADPAFQFERKVEKVIERNLPGIFYSRYALVTFSRVPYKVAKDAGSIVDGILKQVCVGLTDPEKVDLQAAKALAVSNLSPLLEPYRKFLD